MNCESFEAWLENRDLHDLSESDKAHRHAAECKACADLLKKDEQLENFIASNLKPVEIPVSLSNLVDISIERAAPRRKRKRFFAGLAICLLLVVSFVTFRADEQVGFATMDELGRYIQHYHLDHGSTQAKFETTNDPVSWLKEHTGAGVEPPDALLAGFTIVGARICMLGHCQAVHMIYEKNGQLVSLFVVDEGEVNFRLANQQRIALEIGDSTVAFYRDSGKIFALVS